MMHHGGNLTYYARLAGCNPSEILDFSANMNPLGPPAWLREEVSRVLGGVVHYPDPDCLALLEAAAARYGVDAAELFACNGTSEALFVLSRVLGRMFGLRRAIVPGPAYVDYRCAAEQAGLNVATLLLEEAEGFRVDFAALDGMLGGGSALVFLGRPNNPTGVAVAAQDVRDIAARRPDSVFVVDEAFADFLEDEDRVVQGRPANVVGMLSLTKFYAVAGLRLGLVAGAPDVVDRLKAASAPWAVNGIAQAVGARALRDAEYARRSRAECARLRRGLSEALAAVPGLRVYPGEANYLLCRLERGSGQELFDKLITRRIALRTCGNYDGLDDRYFRVAVRTEDDNARLVSALAQSMGQKRSSRRQRKTPAIMFQGTCSDAGKSLLAAAMCRILLRRGLRVAPFKAQNMSLNSFVTLDGGEMGRAQATQAAACRLEPDVRMNPVLLKPSSDTGSQVIVMGKPVGTMRVGAYIDYKRQAVQAVHSAYDGLAAESDVMVLEGAGSPAEINLKAHDIVNMHMAGYAQARVLLVADIDRGGSYASLIGTMECLEERERALVKGFVLNKFRGDASLLAPANDMVLYRTGVPVLGVIPYEHDHGLPEEDSVSFKAGRLERERGAAELDIAVIDLRHISNFTDFDAFGCEPDVHVRQVRRPEELGFPDAILLPGSKNTIGDMRFLRETGLFRAILDRVGKAEIVGICGGLQMLGRTVADPLGVESEALEIPGLSLLPLRTTLDADKTLVRAECVHSPSGLKVSGYEIHHGVSTPLSDDLLPCVVRADGKAVGFGLPEQRVWGTYLHGVFDADDFRRLFLDSLRVRKGLAPVGQAGIYDIQPALDRLADVVESNMDMERVLRMLGL